MIKNYFKFFIILILIFLLGYTIGMAIGIGIIVDKLADKFIEIAAISGIQFNKTFIISAIMASTSYFQGKYSGDYLQQLGINISITNFTK